MKRYGNEMKEREEETCVSHKGQAVSLLVAIQTRRRNVHFPHKGQAVSLHIIVTAMNHMKTKFIKETPASMKMMGPKMVEGTLPRKTNRKKKPTSKNTVKTKRNIKIPDFPKDSLRL